jgi:protein phosphatase
VPAAQVYAVPSKPFLPEFAPGPVLTAQQQHDDLLDFADVSGKRIISTRLAGNVTIREGHAAAALEVMSRFAVNPRWLIYLPPTMSPSETSQQPGLLEHPADAFDHYLHHGVARLICEEKHMGSRAVVVICRDDEAARRRFGTIGEGAGIVYTRTGRRFFLDDGVEKALLERLRTAMDRAGFWEALSTDWACLDCELMPWSMKAQELLRSQYAAVGSAGRAALGEAIATLQQAAAREQSGSCVVPQADAPEADPAGVESATSLLERHRIRATMLDDYSAAYRRYCWPVRSLDDLKLAPFHLLATESGVHVDRDHVWHMDTLAGICRQDESVLLATPCRVVDVSQASDREAAITWWQDLTGRGGEGMVVKPLDFVVKGRRGLVQPALKCRGREYLRIIYGPEYTAPEHLDRLRKRGLALKRSLALREFALGIEGLERFVRGEPLRRVHECAFAVLAMESEPVDPRL